MPTLTLTEVLGEPRRWSGKNGSEFDSWKVKADDGTTYEINTKAGNAVKLGPDDFEVVPPKEGTSFPPKLRRQSQQQGGPRGRSPQETARIERMAAHKTAAQILGPMVPGAESWGQYREQFLEVTNWLIADLPGGSQASPAPSQSPSTPAPKGFSSEEQAKLFTRLLKQAGGSDATASFITWYAREELTSSDISAAIDTLKTDAARACAKELATDANAWSIRTGNYQPDDSDLPAVA